MAVEKEQDQIVEVVDEPIVPNQGSHLTRREFNSMASKSVAAIALAGPVSETMDSFWRMQERSEIGSCVEGLRAKMTRGVDHVPFIQSEKEGQTSGADTYSLSFSTTDHKDYRFSGLSANDRLELARIFSGNGKLSDADNRSAGNLWKIPVILAASSGSIQLNRRQAILIALGATVAAVADAACSGRPPEGLSSTATATLQALKDNEYGRNLPNPNNVTTPVANPFKSQLNTEIDGEGTISVTATPTPTLFPSITTTPEPSPTLTVRSRYTAETWVSKVPKDTKINKEMIGKADPKNFYPLVGAIDLKHRKSLDLQVGSARLVAVTDRDMKDGNITVDNQNAWRNAIANCLDNSSINVNELRHDIQGAINLVRDVKKGKVNEKDIYIVLEGITVSGDSQLNPDANTENARIAQVIVKNGDNYERYRYIGENGKAELVQFAKPGAREMDKDKPKETEFALMEKLEINGDKLFAKGSDRVVQLKGAQIQNPLHNRTQESYTKAIGYIDVLKSWGANFIDLPVYIDGITGEENLNLIVQLVEYAERNGMYIKITPNSFSKTGYNDLPDGLPNDQVISSLQQIALKLNPYNNVILGMWNETKLPGKGGYSESSRKLYDAAEKTIKAIRSVNEDMLVDIPGIETSHNFRPWMDKPISFKNVWYGVMDDPWGFDGEGKPVDRREDWKVLLDGSHAVFLREFGFGGDKNTQNEAERSWMKDSLKIVNDHGLSYTAFSMGTWAPTDLMTADKAKSTGILAPNAGKNYLTIRGQVVYDDLQQYNPTQIDQ